jgi:hypothetical protein
MLLALAAESLAQAGRADPLVRAASHCQVAAYAAWAAPAGREQKPRTQGKRWTLLYCCQACYNAEAAIAAASAAGVSCCASAYHAVLLDAVMRVSAAPNASSSTFRLCVVTWLHCQHAHCSTLYCLCRLLHVHAVNSPHALHAFCALFYRLFTRHLHLLHPAGDLPRVPTLPQRSLLLRKLVQYEQLARPPPQQQQQPAALSEKQQVRQVPDATTAAAPHLGPVRCCALQLICLRPSVCLLKKSVADRCSPAVLPVRQLAVLLQPHAAVLRRTKCMHNVKFKLLPCITALDVALAPVGDAFGFPAEPQLLVSVCSL